MRPIDVMANDHDANGDDIAVADFDAMSNVGGTVAIATGEAGERDQLVYTPPDLGLDDIVVGSCPPGQTLSPQDCQTCVDRFSAQNPTCMATSDCGSDEICVGGRCRLNLGCTGALVDACGQPCPLGDQLLWLAADDLDSVEDWSGFRGSDLTDGAEVVSWFDRSGHGRDAIAYVSGREPAVVLAGADLINRRPTVRFAEDFLEARDIDVRPETHNAITSIAVSRHSSGVWGKLVWVQQQNGFDKRQHDTIGASVGEAGCTTVIYDAAQAAHEHWLNFAAQDVAAGNPLEPGGEGIGIGAMLYAWPGYEGAYFHDLVLAELLIFGRALTGDERRQIEAYLAKKWDLPIADSFWYAIVDETGLTGAGRVLISLAE